MKTDRNCAAVCFPAMERMETLLFEERLNSAEQKYDELTQRLQDETVTRDPKKLGELMREYKRLTPIVECYKRYKSSTEEIDSLEQMLTEEELEPELREIALSDLASEKKKALDCEAELKTLLTPDDESSDRNVIVEIRSGAGGEEAALFAHSLFRMYSMYAEKQGWELSIISHNQTELGGTKEIIFTLSGNAVYAKMRFESGVHRVQRVPETETQGRIHTSTATVAVLKEVPEVELELDPNDLRIDTFRSSGAGGQHINKTSSAIRVTHIPTGMVVECQDERSQYKNKDRALSILRARLYARAQAEQDAKVASERKLQVGSGDRSEKIRTYNFPQSRLTDHRIGFSLYRLGDVMNGDLDPILDALAQAEQALNLTKNAGE